MLIRDGSLEITGEGGGGGGGGISVQDFFSCLQEFLFSVARIFCLGTTACRIVLDKFPLQEYFRKTHPWPSGNF